MHPSVCVRNTHICGQESNCLVSASFVKQDHRMDLQTNRQRTCSWQNSCMSTYGLFAPHATHPTRSLYSMLIPHSNACLNRDLRRALLDLSINCCFSRPESIEKSDSEGVEGKLYMFDGTNLRAIAPIDASDEIVDNDMSTLGRWCQHCWWHQHSQELPVRDKSTRTAGS